uniref:BHLH domain-containing protein n=1 Tax=Anopheles maculatus TaxID=74869 RepID=A0A182SPE1_9DIPT
MHRNRSYKNKKKREDKKPKQSREDICAKACIREHNRLMKMNECYDQLRDQLDINPSTSKANTLVEAVQYIKMLKHVLEVPQEEDDGNDANGGQVTEPQMDDLETAQELEQQYTLKEDFRAILPAEKQDMSLSKLGEEMPYFIKLLSLTGTQKTSEPDAEPCTEPENCTTVSCKPSPLVDDEETTAQEEVAEQTPNDLTNETDAQQEPCFTTNSFNFLIKNLLSLPSDDSDESTDENELLCPPMKDEGNETQGVLPCSTQTADSFPAVQEPEQTDTEHSLVVLLDADLDEAGFEWLDRNLTECDEFFSDHNVLIELDIDGQGFEELFGYTNH